MLQSVVKTAVIETIRDMFKNHLENANWGWNETFEFNTTKILNGTRVLKNIPEYFGYLNIHWPILNLQALDGGLIMTSNIFVTNPNDTKAT